MSNILPTTSLRKIASLRKKIKVVQGGQGAGKTISILILLINHAFRTPSAEILILSAELTKMRLTVIKDFVKVMRLTGYYQEERFLAGTLYKFPNGAFIKFIGLDKSDVGKGLRSTVAYFNEVNKIDSETYRQVASRSKSIYADFNPDTKFFVHEDIIHREDCDFLTLTFEDNEQLSKEERDEILNYKVLGYNSDGTIKNNFWANKWLVYGMGQLGKKDGAILTNWKKGRFNDDLPYGFGLDWGSKDPFTLTKFAIDHKRFKIYVKNLVYKSDLSTADIKERVSLHVKDEIIIADSANRTGIHDLREWGFNAYPSYKGSVVGRLTDLQSYELIIDDSPEVEDELNNYIWLDRRGNHPIDDHNHVIDPLGYYYLWSKRNR